MERACQNCSALFDIPDADLKFYKKISPVFSGKKYDIPPPTLCPECRMKRRLSFRNERKLYKRKCDSSQKECISIYSPEKPFRIYTPKYWWSDAWNPLAFGRDFDFQRPFFEQLAQLWREVPLLSLNVVGNENCEFVSYCGYSKNCYLTYNCDYSEDLMYCSDSIRCKSSMDIHKCIDSELCYQSIDLHNCYNVLFSQYSRGCSDSGFLYDCRNCQYCFGCANLRNASYHIYNTQYSPKEYFRKLSQLQQMPEKELQHVVSDFLQQYPRPAGRVENSENVSGEYISGSKNITASFDVEKCQDIKYCGTVNTITDCYDWDYTGYSSEYCYELSSCGDRIHTSLFSFNIWSGGQNLIYCVLGSGLKDCFGSVGLRQKQYCVLNKQYSKEEYESLVSKIIEHMQKTGEWGEFFPPEICPFAYNESVAYDYFPLSKEEVRATSWQWKEMKDPEYPNVTKTIPGSKLPNDIRDIPDDILNWAIHCEKSGRVFQIQKSELEFYRKMNLPVPHYHPDVRHARRIQLRNPRKLWKRNCMKCRKEIQTTYAPDRPETVYCEECYSAAVY